MSNTFEFVPQIIFDSFVHLGNQLGNKYSHNRNTAITRIDAVDARISVLGGDVSELYHLVVTVIVLIDVTNCLAEYPMVYSSKRLRPTRAKYTYS